LYLAAGIPVVVWTQAAIAQFVLANHCGIAVDSLEEIHDKIAALSQEEYETMRKNALQLSEKLRTGFFTLQAIEKAQTMQHSN
ncbi:MAG: hypothetical protein LUE06_10315, partial [Oscillospiraceae bacterium]|nr:hypothetical protein [Oscillospiraceae bacterium]